MQEEEVEEGAQEVQEEGAEAAAVSFVRAEGDGAGEVLDLGGARLTIKVASDDTGGGFLLTEARIAPGYGPPPHTHSETTDSFYVLEGVLTVRIGEETRELGPGEYALAPPGTVHAFSNDSDSEVRVLGVQTPAGFEGYFRELSELIASGDFDPAVANEIGARYDIHSAQ
jgi:quercetin dioxygenase-like cupin family protein